MFSMSMSKASTPLPTSFTYLPARALSFGYTASCVTQSQRVIGKERGNSRQLEEPDTQLVVAGKLDLYKLRVPASHSLS